MDKALSKTATRMGTIYLIGFRCAGKTTVGRILADLAGVEFLDLDRSVENRAGRAISEIVADRGWPFFRALEKEILRATAGLGATVVATGGGIILDPDNVTFMRNNGTVVLLHAPREVILERIGRDERAQLTRPSLTGNGTVTEAMAVLDQRTPLYRAAADFGIDTSILEPEEAAEEILKTTRRSGYGRKQLRDPV
jgi:shikimate kinase